MALWALLAIAIGVFAGAFHPLAATDGRTRHLRKAFGIAAIVYGAVLVVGTAAGESDPLRPLDFLTRTASGPAQPETAETVVRSPAELRAALADARNAGRPILVDFTADWCTACKTMEREVFADPGIRQKLRGVTVIRADVTDTNRDTAALMQEHGVVGPPTLLFFDPRSGTEIAAARTIGEVSAGEFGRTLERIGSGERLANDQSSNPIWRNK